MHSHLAAIKSSGYWETESNGYQVHFLRAPRGLPPGSSTFHILRLPPLPNLVELSDVYELFLKAQFTQIKTFLTLNANGIKSCKYFWFYLSAFLNICFWFFNSPFNKIKPERVCLWCTAQTYTLITATYTVQYTVYMQHILLEMVGMHDIYWTNKLSSRNEIL